VARFPTYAPLGPFFRSPISTSCFHCRDATTAPAALDQAIEAARRAVALDPTNVRALQAQMLGLFFKNEVEAALRVGERAVALNPNDTEIVGEYGMRLALSGEWARGCPLIEQAHARNPSPQADYEVMLGLCSYMQGDYQKALFWVRRADLQKSPLYHFIVGAIYGQLGDATAAERERQWILANAPGLLRNIHHELQMRIKEPRDQQQTGSNAQASCCRLIRKIGSTSAALAAFTATPEASTRPDRLSDLLLTTATNSTPASGMAIQSRAQCRA
jgi:tetratricopeptide (TPR) repeat protein